jgi:hypothetical protein
LEDNEMGGEEHAADVAQSAGLDPGTSFQSEPGGGGRGETSPHGSDSHVDSWEVTEGGGVEKHHTHDDHSKDD